jgi:fumarate reductase flavoprotein subunit
MVLGFGREIAWRRSRSCNMRGGHVIERLETDVLILGSGGAGLFAALHAHQANPHLRITVATKGLLGKSGCTRMVQGGYNVALIKGDSIERHFMDTIDGGKWLPNQELAWTLVVKAIERVRELENEIGCFFDRNPDGSLHGKAFAGQTFDRTVHKGDLTGIEIINRLMEQVWARPSIHRLEEHRAIALIPEKGGQPKAPPISGALFIDVRTGGFRLVTAKAVLLATGGGPTMYKYHTPSGDKAMDGLAMALDYGLPLRDMEMVQFHPTGVLAGPDTRMTGTIIEEGLRGAGGYLLDGSKQRFMFNYDPRGERATRDLVSQSMYREMMAGRTTPNGGLYIAMGHLGPEKVRKQFKGMVERCADCGFDLAGGLVEVVPTAHYLMGGVVVKVDTSTEATGLYCAGEDAGGVHGANRLGGNGVANSTVYGGIAGETMAADIKRGLGLREPDMDVVKASMEAAEAPFREPASAAGGQPKAASGPVAGGQPKAPGNSANQIRDTLLALMWDDVGIIRDKSGMERALGRLEALEGELATAGVPDRDRAFNLSWHDWLNLRSQLTMSKVVARAALQRENSRGAHFREDFKEPGDLATSRFTVVRQVDGKLEVGDEAVAFTRVKPGESLLQDPPQAAE